MSKKPVPTVSIKQIIMSKTKNQFGEEEEVKTILFNNLFESERLYESIVAQLDIDHEDKVYRELVLGMLKRQTHDHIVFQIWHSLAADQAKHLREYMGQIAVTVPSLTADDIIIKFALMYPDLRDKVFKSLTGFFKYFIRLFNEKSPS